LLKKSPSFVYELAYSDGTTVVVEIVVAVNAIVMVVKQGNTASK